VRAVVIHEPGDRGLLRYEEVEPPEPDEGELLIRVRATSVNPADWKARRGFRALESRGTGLSSGP